jgi:hypothetical protein
MESRTRNSRKWGEQNQQMQVWYVTQRLKKKVQSLHHFRITDITINSKTHDKNVTFFLSSK